MQTDELIARLSADHMPPAWAPVRTLGLGVAVGAVVSFTVMVLWLGIRPDLAVAVSTSAYWIKFGYTAALAALAFWLVERLARPGASWEAPLAAIFIPIVAIAGIASMDMMRAPPAMREHMMMGASANVCPWRIIALSIPIFIGAFWALRRLAPTRLIVAGAATGLLAGALGAWIYAFHCDESAAPFVAIFYTLGMAAVGAAGAAIGHFVLRW